MTSGTTIVGTPRAWVKRSASVCNVTPSRARCSLESAPVHETPEMSHDPPLPLPSDRSFGTVFVVFFSLVAVLVWWRGGTWARWPAGLSVLTLVITLARPSLLHPLNKAWMKLAEVLNRIVSPVVLGLIYFGLFTPVAACMRLAGRDVLRRKVEPAVPSYWIGRDPPGPDPQSLPNQF